MDKSDHRDKLDLYLRMTKGIAAMKLQEEGVTDEEINAMSQEALTEKALEIMVAERPKSMRMSPYDSGYRQQLLDEFTASLRKGVQFSRRDVDIYTVQDDDGYSSPYIIRARLNDDGKFVLMEDCETEQYDDDTADELPPLEEEEVNN
jgi:hypothetical protein